MAARRRPAAGPPGTPRRAGGAEADDVAFDEALACIAALNRRLLQLRRLHHAGRGLRSARCSGCGHRYPCPTARLVTSG